MGRRNAGEGVIYQDKNRGLWIYQVSYKAPDGSVKRKKFAAKTKHEAMEKGRAFLMANQQGSVLLKADMTVAAWIDEWMENYVKPRIRPRIFEKYWSSLKNYIVPKFRSLKLSALEALSLQKHFNSLLLNGRADGNALSPSTVRAARRYFAMCVDDAVREGLVLRKLGDKFARNGLIFTSPFGEPISPTNFTRRYFKPLLKKCNINSDFTFHGLRHTHATLLLQQGVNPKIVQKRLGHSSIKVTMDTYSHVLPDMQRQAVEALRELFK